MSRSPSISELASSVSDNGRRGAPKPGCDCVQCFGYCMVDESAALRARALAGDVQPARFDGKPLEFDA